MPTETNQNSSFPPTPPAEAHEIISQYLTLADGACKRYSVDIYNIQNSNIKNHLWIAFVAISSGAAFFVNANLGALFLGYLKQPTFNFYIFLCALGLAGCEFFAIRAFFNGIKASTGTVITEAYRDLHNQFLTLENNNFTALERYRLRRQTLYDLTLQTTDAMNRMHTRGTLIRQMSTNIRNALVLGIVSVISFLLLHLWQ